MSTVLLVIHLMLAIALVAVILVQKTSADGLSGIGGGGGGNSNFLSGRASANLLTRTTAILAGLFMLNSLVLGVIASHRSTGPSLLDKIGKKPAIEAPAVSGEKQAEPKPETEKPASDPLVPIAE